MAKNKKNPKLRKRLQTVGLSVLGVIILVAAQQFLWGFTATVAERLHDHQSQLRQIGEVKERIAKMRENQNDSRIALDRLESVVPKSTNVLQVLERLEAVAGSVGVSLVVTAIQEESVEGGAAEATQATRVVISGDGGQLTPEPAGTDENRRLVVSLPVEVVVVGSPALILSYVEAIENLEEITQILTMSMTEVERSGEQSAPLGSYQATIEVSFYLQQQTNGEEAK